MYNTLSVCYNSLLTLSYTTDRASLGNVYVLEHILSQDGCDVDPINRIEKATPLHLALRIEDEDVRQGVVESLLDAGADTTYVMPYSISIQLITAMY